MQYVNYPLPTPTPVTEHLGCVRQSYIVAASTATFAPTSQLACPDQSVHGALDILAQPSDTFSVSLPHDNTAHEDLNGSDALKRHLALASSLVQAQSRAELVLRYSLGVIDLVAEDNEGGVLKLLHGQESVELGLGLVEALVVFCVDEEDDAGHFRDCIETGVRLWPCVMCGCGGTDSSRATVVGLVRDLQDRRL
jgi:hypothetical protein